MRIDGHQLPESPLWTLRSVLGDALVGCISMDALELTRRYRTVEERAVLAELFRLHAEDAAWKEEDRAHSDLARD